MIDKQHNKTVFICDNCGDGTEEYDNYNEAQHEAKEDGWQKKYINGKCMNYCPLCSEVGRYE